MTDWTSGPRTGYGESVGNLITGDELVRRCREASASAAPERAVAAVLHEVLANDPAGIRASLADDGATMRPGGLHVLADSPDLTVFHATLPPGFVNAPHDHRTWAVIGVYEGEEHNVFYERRGGSIAPVSELDATAPRVVAMPIDAIHAIENRLPIASRAIHVYGGAHFHVVRSMWHPATLEEHPRDDALFFQWCREMMAAGERLPAPPPSGDAGR